MAKEGHVGPIYPLGLVISCAQARVDARPSIGNSDEPSFAA
jgi:hypothetical protein